MRGVAAAFVWRLISAGGGEGRFSDEFADRAEAEAWLGSAWEDLAGDGVEEVELLERAEGDAEPRSIYRMSLAEG
jgi:hypothetical protein